MAKILFICPTVPAPGGNGLAMRAGVTLDGLSAAHDVYVAVVSWPGASTSDVWAKERCVALVEIPQSDDNDDARSWMHTSYGRSALRTPLPSVARARPPAVGCRIADTFGETFDVIVVMRTYLAGVAIPFLEAGTPSVLDADDDEAASFRSRARFDTAAAEEATRFEALQKVVFRWFDRVAFAATCDAVPPFVHIPNGVAIPPARAVRPRSRPVELLFVGTPHYLPNVVAVDRLRTRILPAISATGIQVRLHHPGPNDALNPFYERAHVVVAPLQSGGGTRIKLLEAFANGCPVVATPTATRGLRVANGEHLVVADSDDDDEQLTRAIIDLAADDARRADLAAAAYAYVARHHDRLEVGARLRKLVDDLRLGLEIRA